MLILSRSGGGCILKNNTKSFVLILRNCFILVYILLRIWIINVIRHKNLFETNWKSSKFLSYHHTLNISWV